MGIFDRFRRSRDPARDPEPAAAPKADAKAVILLGRDVGWPAVLRLMENRFGPRALTGRDGSHPNAPAVRISLEGVSFFCSYMAMPYPPQVCDLASIQEGLFSPEEKEVIPGNQAFLVLARQDGGTTQVETVRACRLFTRLAAALLDTESALGVYVDSPELLVSRRVYLYHAEILEQHFQDLEYFPAPLWVSIRHGQKGDLPLTGTWGLKQFGFPELWFINPEADWPEIHQRLYLMSMLQITGRELYRDGDTIQFTPGKTSVFRALNGALWIMDQR